MFSNHNRDVFHITCYSDSNKQDEITRRFASVAHVWRNMAGKTDDQFVRQIFEDGIDILVNLAVHSPGGRPLVCAHNPAPLQLAWLPYPATTGLSVIGYRITDVHIDPLGTRDKIYSECSVRLPHTFWAYDPLDNETTVQPLPAAQRGQITFGCLSDLSKITEKTLDLWRQVLNQIPTSRLIVRAPSKASEARLTEMLNFGDRLQFVPDQSRPDDLKTHYRIDIALDTFPFNGAAESFDAFWMGVPVLTLAGNTGVSRTGMSLAANLGLADQLVANTAEQFVERATKISADLPALAQLRSGAHKCSNVPPSWTAIDSPATWNQPILKCGRFGAEVPDQTPDQLFELAISRHEAGALDEAESLCRQILQSNPDDADTLQMLGILNHQLGKLDAAESALRRAAFLQPDAWDGQYHLGAVLRAAHKLDEAIDAFKRAIALAPDIPELHAELGNTFMLRGQTADAIDSLRTALNLRPDFPEPMLALGIALITAGDYSQAVEWLSKFTARDPSNAHGHFQLARALRLGGFLNPAIDAYRASLRISPNHIEAAHELALTLQLTGRNEAAAAALRSLLDRHPHLTSVWSTYLYILHFQPDDDPAKLLREHRRWNDKIVQPHIRPKTHFRNTRSPTRRLKIGYVSADFRRHSCCFFTIPLLSNHNREAFEVHCYSDLAEEDEITRRIAGYADVWRKSLPVADQQLANQIEQDGIDILVDLQMHTSGGRPMLFAQKPAPVQVAWLAYPSTTGLPAMDYRLTDPYLDPPGRRDEFYSEKSLRLPDTFWCYDPLDEGPEIQPLPASRDGFITFGCLNKFSKITPPTCELWKQVLAQVPNSRLLVLTPSKDCEKLLADALDIGDRLQFLSMQPRGISGRLSPHRHRIGYLPLQRSHHELRLSLDGRSRRQFMREFRDRPRRLESIK